MILSIYLRNSQRDRYVTEVSHIPLDSLLISYYKSKTGVIELYMYNHRVYSKAVTTGGYVFLSLEVQI